jgi:hypothetical protein
MVNCGVKPILAASRRSSLAQSEWKVPIHSPAGER